MIALQKTLPVLKCNIKIYIYGCLVNLRTEFTGILGSYLSDPE